MVGWDGLSRDWSSFIEDFHCMWPVIIDLLSEGGLFWSPLIFSLMVSLLAARSPLTFSLRGSLLVVIDLLTDGVSSGRPGAARSPLTFSLRGVSSGRH